VPFPAHIRALAFDLDNTLWDVEPVIERAEQILHAWLAAHYPRIPELFSLEAMRTARYELARAQPERAYDYTWLRVESLARHARACGYDAAVADEAFEVFFAARNEVETFADVRPALARLSGRFALASLSNGNADLVRIGLADLFTVSLNARGIGCAKPDRRVFEALATALALKPLEIAYVGDDPYLDVEGARSAGMHTIWMNRLGTAWPDTVPRPDLIVRDCTELADRLARDA
jgi:FMN hydrolase / 5-amino-6-(5-phospho-D-ribitylamino)uracil phosphatase